MIGLDTSAIIDIFRGEEDIKRFLEHNKEPLAATIISYLELFFGFSFEHPNHTTEAHYYREFFQRIYPLDLTEESCEKASEVFWRLKKDGNIIEKFDCVIAAIFLIHGVDTVLTRNEKHFSRIKGLRVVSY